MGSYYTLKNNVMCAGQTIRTLSQHGRFFSRLLSIKPTLPILWCCLVTSADKDTKLKMCEAWTGMIFFCYFTCFTVQVVPDGIFIIQNATILKASFRNRKQWKMNLKKKILCLILYAWSSLSRGGLWTIWKSPCFLCIWGIPVIHWEREKGR